jgi:hypothetical protein
MALRAYIGTPVGISLLLISAAVSLISRFCTVRIGSGHRPWPVRIECWTYNASLSVKCWVWPTADNFHDAKFHRLDTGSAIKHYEL